MTFDNNPLISCNHLAYTGAEVEGGFRAEVEDEVKN